VANNDPMCLEPDSALQANTNKSLADFSDQLRQNIPNSNEYTVYRYILSTVVRGQEHDFFRQMGSAPNFLGGLVSLTTCKRFMRTWSTVASGEKLCIAGFTSNGLYQGKHWMFYFMVVQKPTYPSFADFWEALPESVRNAKDATRHHLGDAYRPAKESLADEARFRADSYVPPPIGHAHRDKPDTPDWRVDIEYQARGQRPVLLVGNPKLSFLWFTPQITCTWALSRGQQCVTLPNFLSQLHQAP